MVMINLNEEYKVVAESLHQLLVDINKQLGSESPEDWTRDGIMNKIIELQKEE